MISVFKIFTKDLLRYPDITWDLAIISQDIEELTDAFLFIIDTVKVYEFVQHLRPYSISYEAYIKPGRNVRIISKPKRIYTCPVENIFKSRANVVDKSLVGYVNK